MFRRVAFYFFMGLGCAAGAAPVERMYVFGDSYSDIGAGYLDGNGPTAVAYLATRLGLDLVSSNATEVRGKSLDFAVSGGQTGSGSGKTIGEALLGVGMQNQVEDFARRVRSKAIQFKARKTLFFLAGGLNDRELASETTVGNLESEIRTLYALGARRFAVALLPTEIPAFREVGLRLNPEIAKIPAAMNAALRGVHVELSHWGAFFDEAMREPARFGLTNTTDACAGRAIFHEDATPCANPSAYFYYHAGHPSTAVHRAVGERLYEELEESR